MINEDALQVLRKHRDKTLAELVLIKHKDITLRELDRLYSNHKYLGKVIASITAQVEEDLVNYLSSEMFVELNEYPLDIRKKVIDKLVKLTESKSQ